MTTIPVPPPPPPVRPEPTLPPELLEDDEFTEKRFQKELQFRIVCAIENGNVALAQELIDKGLNTNATILLVKTPLIHALEQSPYNISVISALVNAKGTDVNLRETTPWGKKPLHYIAQIGSLELAKLILSRANCDINITENGGTTPLHFAARYGHKELAVFFIENGADVNAHDDCGRTPLHRACEYAHKDVAEMLMEKGACVNSVDNFNWTPIFHAIFFNRISVIFFLLNHGADVNVRDIYGYSLLHIACYNSLSEIHKHKYPELVALKTSFDYYQRKKRIPPEEFQDLLLLGLSGKMIYDNHWVFDVVKRLLNTGIDPKVYSTDDLYCVEMSVLAKTRAYLILAGAMLPFDDALLHNDSKNFWRCNWFYKQRESQLSLQRQCRYTIRRCLAYTRDIEDAITKLPLPEKLKRVLNLEDDFNMFLTHCDDGGVYEATLES